MKKLLLVIPILLLACKETTHKDNAMNDEQFKAKKYRMAYNVLFDGENDNYEVFSMDLDGGDKKNITQLPGVEWTYNAAGKDLYVISDKDTAHRNYFLYRTDAVGSKYEKVLDVRLSDSWIGSRKGGTELIVEPHRTVDTAFYLIDFKGKILDTIEIDLPYFNDPHFSPDGSKIVFRGALKPFKKDSGYLDELYIMNADGSNLQQLTHYPKADTTAKWHNYHAGPPRWHPTKDFISYQSVQKGRSTLFAISPDGSKQWQLFKQDSLNQGWHDWSSDGKWLAIEVFNLERTEFDIQLVNWETKEVKILTDSTYTYDQAPVFVEVED